jgi:hypothetical protein
MLNKKANPFNIYGFNTPEAAMLRNMDNQTRQNAYNRRFNNTNLTTGSVSAYGPRTAEGYASKLSELAQKITASDEAPMWGANSPVVPQGVPTIFANKWKCNVFPAYLANAIYPQADLHRNMQRGDLISAKQIRQGIDNPDSLSKVYNGQIIPVPQHLLPYATGAVLSRRNRFGSHHTGIITDKGTTVSPSSDSLVHNMFGFRNEQQAKDGDSVSAAWFLPKGMDGTALKRNAELRYMQDLVAGNLNKPRVVPQEVYNAELQRAKASGAILPNITYQDQPMVLRELYKSLYGGKKVKPPVKPEAPRRPQGVRISPRVLKGVMNTDNGIF